MPWWLAAARKHLPREVQYDTLFNSKSDVGTEEISTNFTHKSSDTDLEVDNDATSHSVEIRDGVGSIASPASITIYLMASWSFNLQAVLSHLLICLFVHLSLQRTLRF